MSTREKNGSTERIQREQHNSEQPFLKLPAELRLAICSYILPTDQIVDIQEPQIWHTFNVQYGKYEGLQVLLQAYAVDRKPCTDRVTMAITQMCRKLREENLHRYYSSNTFLVRVQSSEAMCPRTMKWFDTRSDEALYSIRKVLAVRPDACHVKGRLTDRAWLLDLKERVVCYVHQGKCAECSDRQKKDREGIQRRLAASVSTYSGSLMPQARLQSMLKDVGGWTTEDRNTVDGA